MSPRNASGATPGRSPKKPPLTPEASSVVSFHANNTRSHSEELRSLKATVADLQAKRLSALRLYQDEKVRRQQETARVEELTAEVHALKCATLQFSPTDKSIPRSNLSRNAPSSSPLQPQMLLSASINYPANPSQNPIPTVAPVQSQVSLDGLTARISTVARLPPGLPTSLTWHSLSLANVLPQPPQIVALLNHVVVTSVHDSNGTCKSLPGNDQSSITHALPSSNAYGYAQIGNFQGHENLNRSCLKLAKVMPELKPYADEKDGILVDSVNETIHSNEEDSPAKFVGDFESVCSINYPPDLKVFESPEHLDLENECEVQVCNSSESDFQEMCHSGSKENSTLHVDTFDDSSRSFSKLQAKLKVAEDEAAGAHEELRRSEQLLADMKQQLDACTAACKDLINTISEQEETIAHLLQR